jgi:glucose 1-dehydrogenase
MRILITGASRGLGRAMAKRLACPGTDLALCASAPSHDLDQAVAECTALGARAAGLHGDLGQAEVPQRLVDEAVARFGGLDGVVSNAGIVKSGSLFGIEPDAWDRVFTVNVRSVWLLARAADVHLRASAGAMVVTASMSGVEPYPGTGAYSPSKAALLMLVRVLAQEWAAAGVRINAVSPGLFATPMTAPLYADAQIKSAREALVPMHRIGSPERDAAGLVAFLLSDDARYLTGQNVVVDGGLLDSIQAQLAGRPSSARV